MIEYSESFVVTVMKHVRLILRAEVRLAIKKIRQCLIRFVELYSTVLQIFDNVKGI